MLAFGICLRLFVVKFVDALCLLFNWITVCVYLVVAFGCLVDWIRFVLALLFCWILLRLLCYGYYLFICCIVRFVVVSL